MNYELLKQYTLDVKNRYETLLHSEFPESPIDNYDLFLKANMQMLKSHLFLSR